MCRRAVRRRHSDQSSLHVLSALHEVPDMTMAVAGGQTPSDRVLVVEFDSGVVLLNSPSHMGG